MTDPSSPDGPLSSRAALSARRARRRSLPTAAQPNASHGWTIAQGIALFGLSASVFALIAYPTLALRVFWNAVVPLLPVSFLLVPSVWRAVCPLASINMMGTGLGSRCLPSTVQRSSGVSGIALLAVLVPARRFELNHDANVVVGVLIGCAVVAAVCGVLFEAKAGFCNSACPILPVERLYGQRPLFDVGNPRCLPCTLCTPRGCLDLSPVKSVPQVFGPARRSSAWLGTAFGIFSASFPGFVLGYFNTADTTLEHAPSVYGVVLLYAVASYVLFSGVIRLLKVPSSAALPALAGLAAGIYYWNGTPVSLDALGAPPVVGVVVRWVMLAVIAAWGLHALRPQFSERRVPRVPDARG